MGPRTNVKNSICRESFKSSYVLNQYTHIYHNSLGGCCLYFSFILHIYNKPTKYIFVACFLM